MLSIKYVEIQDITGKVINRISGVRDSNIAIDIKHLAKGVYLLVVKNENRTMIKRFTKA